MKWITNARWEKTKRSMRWKSIRWRIRMRRKRRRKRRLRKIFGYRKRRWKMEKR